MTTQECIDRLKKAELAIADAIEAFAVHTRGATLAVSDEDWQAIMDWAGRRANQPQYPKWFLVEDFGVERVDDQKYGVIFGRRLSLSTPQSRHAIRAHCTREQAVERLAQIVRDPVVAWDGYKARVWPTYSGDWGWDASRDKEAVAHCYAPTEPAARLALAGWLLDNTLVAKKETP